MSYTDETSFSQFHTRLEVYRAASGIVSYEQPGKISDKLRISHDCSEQHFFALLIALLNARLRIEYQVALISCWRNVYHIAVLNVDPTWIGQSFATFFQRCQPGNCQKRELALQNKGG
jgi:hypothetical protein